VPARLTLHPPHRASVAVLLYESKSAVIGRDPECDVVLDDPRISKRHAALRALGTGWVLEDLGSKNGSSVDGRPAAGQPLLDGCWLSLGGVLGRFERLTPEAVRAIEEDRQQRRDTSASERRALEEVDDPLALLERLLRSALSLTRTTRGFVLVAGSAGQFRPEVAAGLGPLDLRSGTFSGSLGALERVIGTGRAVVTHDAQKDPHLAGRDSVVSSGLRGLACVPLLHERRILGILYVDGQRSDVPLTELDLEILETLADHASLVLAARDAGKRLHALLQRDRSEPRDPVLQLLVQRLAVLPRPAPPTDTGLLPGL
jgi:GAF domain-containing protein